MAGFEPRAIHARRRAWTATPVVFLTLLAALLVPSTGSGNRDGDDRGGHRDGQGRGHGHGKKHGGALPETIPLPNGFQPEGIASRGGKDVFVGSIPTGAIWTGNVRSGAGEIRVPAHDGRSAVGIKVDRRERIFVAGGTTGDAYVYDAESGSDLARYDLAPDGADTFVNDVVLTKRAAYFTDSRLQQLYVLPLGPGGELPAQADVKTLPLTGDIVYAAGNNANGIVAAGHQALIIVQTNTGKLFRVDRETGVTREIDLGGATAENGDGLLRRGRKLFVVQNRSNQIAVFKLRKGLESARLKRTLTDFAFDVPTTLTFAARHLYTVNARFTTTPGPDVKYDVVKVG